MQAARASLRMSCTLRLPGCRVRTVACMRGPRLCVAAAAAGGPSGDKAPDAEPSFFQRNFIGPEVGSLPGLQSTHSTRTCVPRHWNLAALCPF